jgi:UDP-glucose 4-epimerase
VVALVTGDRGFLGSHATAALRAEGWSVVGAGRPDTEIPSLEFTELVRRTRPEVVVHCAGPASVQAAELDPEDDRRRAVGTLETLLALLAGVPDSRLVLVSSAAVYGEPNDLPIGVDAGISPISAYGRHRADCERLAAASGVPSAFARVFSAYGEGLRRQVWWDISSRALRAETIFLHGTGAESRDFLHGSDVGLALATIARRGAFDGEAYNIASGEETTIAVLARALVTALGTGTTVEFSGLERRGDPHRWRADVSELAALGFEPRVPLVKGIERYAAWVRSVL